MVLPIREIWGAREKSVKLILPETDGRISDLEVLRIILDNPYTKFRVVLLVTGKYLALIWKDWG